MKHRGLRSGCPVHFALEAIGDSWSLLIVRDLFYTGIATYTELLRAGEGISTNILASRLARLEELGIIARAEGEKGGYRLTPKGKDLFPILREMVVWSAKHDPKTPVPAPIVERLRAGDDPEALVADMRARWERRRGKNHG